MKRLVIIILAIASFISCDQRDKLADAYGNFEADEIIVSAEATGRILELNIEEGTLLEAGTIIGIIDTIQPVLQLHQMTVQQTAIKSKIDGVVAQIETLKQQKENLNVTYQRVLKLLADGAATTQQKEDIEGQLKLIDKQIAASQVQIGSIRKEADVLDAQKMLVKEQKSRCQIVSPSKGIVLEDYVKSGEMAVAGKPLFKMADLSVLDLRCYITSTSLSKLKIGQEVKVNIDQSKTETKTLMGKVKWISSEAEFTPKMIQTKEERVKQVYAVKIAVVNNGELKIGMPAEVIISQ